MRSQLARDYALTLDSHYALTASELSVAVEALEGMWAGVPVPFPTRALRDHAATAAECVAVFDSTLGRIAIAVDGARERAQALRANIATALEA